MKRSCILFAVTAVAACLVSVSARAQMRSEYTEVWEPKPAVVTPGNPATGGAPSDAIILFDGGVFRPAKYGFRGAIPAPMRRRLGSSSGIREKLSLL